MYKAYDNTIMLTRGDSAFFTIEITDSNDTPVDIEDAEIIFSVKRTTHDKETLIKKNGTDIRIEPNDTAELDYGKYVYDVQISYRDGGIDTIITPTPFIISEEVTF